MGHKYVSLGQHKAQPSSASGNAIVYWSVNNPTPWAGPSEQPPLQIPSGPPPVPVQGVVGDRSRLDRSVELPVNAFR